MFHRNSFHLQSSQKVAIQQLDRKIDYIPPAHPQNYLLRGGLSSLDD
jgi:hypothetical protein